MRTFLALILFATAAPCWAERHVLFSAGQFAPDYEQTLARLQPGDELVFSRGEPFLYEGRLGHGRTTLVLAVAGGRALRIPLATGMYRGTTAYREWITEFLRGYERLSNAGVAVVKAFPEESLEGEFAVVERVAVKFTLEEFLSGKLMLPREQSKVAWSRLEDFARTTWPYSRIGDFDSSQLAWDGSRWVLLDFTNIAREYKDHPGSTVFDEVELGEFRAQAIVRAILSARRSADPGSCERLLRKRR